MKTTETKLLTVQVPLDAFEFKTEYEDKYSMLYFKQKSKPDNNPFSTVPTYDDWHFGGVIRETSRKYGAPKIVFVTTIHKENGQIVFSPGFEPEKYVHWEDNILKIGDDFIPAYRDYFSYDPNGDPRDVEWFNEPLDSFLSRIKAENGVYFDNPLGNKIVVLGIKES